MGGSGGSTGYGSDGGDAEALRDQVRADLRRQEFLVRINDYLNEQLRAFNDRDAGRIRAHVDQIVDVLGDTVDGIDRLLFGGSIGKHTYVDGLSDVDALVILRGDQPSDPSELLAVFAASLRVSLASPLVTSVVPGRLAVTVTYTDGTEIQLLPARRAGDTLEIASEDGLSWRQIRPRKFAEKLTQVNQANGGTVVPAVKLAKGILSRLPKTDQLSGYHVEAIAVDAFRSYQGGGSRLAVLRHLLDHAATAVLRPTGDISGQSVNVDGYLGSANSHDRQRVSASIRRIVSRIDSASTIEDVMELFGD